MKTMGNPQKLKTSALKRLKKEYENMQNSSEINISAAPVDPDDLMVWNAIIFGPKGTPYENGTFRVVLHFTSEYPFKPPSVTFITRIFHCNISKRSVCLDVLNKGWSPALTVEKILLSISSLMSDPNPHDPLFTEAAREYLNDLNRYNEIAREWTKKYASEEEDYKE